MNDTASIVVIGLLILIVIVLALKLHETNEALSELVKLCSSIINEVKIHRDAINGLSKLSLVIGALNEQRNQRGETSILEIAKMFDQENKEKK